MRTATVRFLVVVFCLAIFVALLPFAAHADSETQTTRIVVQSAAADGTSVEGITPDDLKQHKQTILHIPVADPTLRTQVKGFSLQKGDFLDITTSTATVDSGSLKSLSFPSDGVSAWNAVLILVLSAALYLILCLVLTLGNPFKLIIGEDGHYSNSKFQMFLWFGILISGYLASVCVKAYLNGGITWGQVAIPNNLLLLSGMSALTFAGAKGITTSKVQTALNAGIADPKKATTKPNFLYDLMHNDNKQLDFGDFQMIIVTLVAVGIYVALILHYLGAMELRAATKLPDVDTTILASFGLGQGAYLTKKAVGNAGDT